MKPILLFLLVASCLASFKAGEWYTVHLDSAKWKVTPGRGGICDAQLINEVETTGWFTLNLIGNQHYNDSLQAYGAGYIEGALTAPLIWSAFMNECNGTTSGMSPLFQEFITENDDWVRGQAADPSTEAEYWGQVGLVLAQFDGLYAAYTEFSPASQQISYPDFLYYQLQYELGDIQSAIGENNTHPMAEHCSVLIKPTAQDLFQSHDTWSTFSSMLRIYKHYTLPYTAAGTAAASVSFSSFPACLPSGDDFYITSAGLTVVETTNEVFNLSLYEATTTQTVPYWIRVIVANRMASDGQSWVDTFALYNSGTYNNQWMVINNNLVTPGSLTLPPNAFWVLEQIPGYCESADLTPVLNKMGYWASYNVPYFPTIWATSGYGTSACTGGPTECVWAQASRAQIFARDQSSVVDMPSMQAMMRYNEWQYDPLALQDACRGISARCDLNAPWVVNSMNGLSCFGGIDSKITTTTLSRTRTAEIVCGPTWDSQSPFAWTQQWQYQPHYGMPQVFAFDFVTAQPSSLDFDY